MLVFMAKRCPSHAQELAEARAADDGGDAVHVGHAGEVEAGDVLETPPANRPDGSSRGSVGLAVGGMPP
ncbi:MAG: hypothetical protein ACLTTU_09110 [Bilophila wadsworthia]